MKCILKELKVTSRIKTLIDQSNKSIIAMKKVSTNSKPYLSKFFYVNLTNIHDSIEQLRDKKLDYQSVKDALETVLYENIHLFGNKVIKPTKKHINRINNVSRGSNLSTTQKLKKLKSNVSSLIEEAENIVRK